MKTLYLIRHAPIEHGGCYTGWQDLPCTLPHALDTEANKPLLNPALAWHCSDLQRARETANWLAGQLGYTPAIQYDHRLREQHFGAWEGKRYADIFSMHPEMDWDDPATLQPPDGESFTNVCARVRSWLDGLEGDALVVAHVGSIRAILAHCLSLTPAEALQLAIDYTSLTAVQHGNLLTLNRSLVRPQTAG